MGARDAVDRRLQHFSEVGMVSALTGFAIALAMALVAALKGRTAWHWFALTGFAFAVLWVATVVVLHFSEIRVSVVSADREIAAFAGAVTAAVMLIILLSVPRRTRRRDRFAEDGHGRAS